MHKTDTLEIRHQISTDGGQPAIEWRVPTLELAKRLVDERRDMLNGGVDQQGSPCCGRRCAAHRQPQGRQRLTHQGRITLTAHR